MINDVRTFVTNDQIDKDEIREFFSKMLDQNQNKVGVELVDIITHQVCLHILIQPLYELNYSL